jgi:hypothetical protein
LRERAIDATTRISACVFHPLKRNAAGTIRKQAILLIPKILAQTNWLAMDRAR